MATTTVPSYPFDPTGTKITNKITGEQQVLTASNPRDNAFLIPKAGPFFGDSMGMSLKDTSGATRALVPNVDFYCTHMFMDASYSTAKPIYASVTMLNTALAGTLTMSYQNVGGEWIPSDAMVAEALANRIGDPRTTSWEQIANVPNAFPVIAHEYDLVDMKGLDDLVTSVNSLTAAIAATSGNNLAAHKAATGNVHNMTAADLGVYTKAESDARTQQIVNQAIAAALGS